jgi:Bacterial sugar transferase
MAPTLAARLSQDNVVSLPKERSHLAQDSVIKLPTARDLVPGRSVERAGHNPRCTARKEPSDSAAKRLCDIAVATGTLIFFAPFLITVAILIKVTSPGPVLFSQYRYGYRNRLFKIYKLRSMRVDACDTAGVKQRCRATTELRRSERYSGKRVSTKFRSLSMSSRATCRWLDRGRTFPECLLPAYLTKTLCPITLSGTLCALESPVSPR